MKLSYPRTFVPGNSNFVSLVRCTELTFQQNIVIIRKPSCCYRRRTTAYTVPVAVLTIKFIQVRWFLSHLKGRGMASFPLKNTFSYPGLFNPKFKNVSLALHYRNFAHREHWHRTNYPCKKFSSTTQRYIRYGETNGRTDERQTTMVPSTPTA